MEHRCLKEDKIDSICGDISSIKKSIEAMDTKITELMKYKWQIFGAGKLIGKFVVGISFLGTLVLLVDKIRSWH